MIVQISLGWSLEILMRLCFDLRNKKGCYEVIGRWKISKMHYQIVIVAHDLLGRSVVLRRLTFVSGLIMELQTTFGGTCFCVSKLNILHTCSLAHSWHFNFKAMGNRGHL
ncbi:hypothetical protein EPI10_032294 [Gossypium australe]|uniref:Uncharacterized protein n=1 Tax=Gossypium australe TaxID=47621 RepID=A0A5B6X2V6_9ROSI|nr:hypothetical protein EPI10_032294 [Gossypium australe]